VTGGLVVGFDLDMTLIDSRPGIGAVYRALAAETGVAIDVDLAISRLGPPLDQELSEWFPSGAVTAMADRFREIYPTEAIAVTPALPGAADALRSVRASGGRVVVITAKYEPNARLHLAHCGLEYDEVVGWAWGTGKRDALVAHGAHVYVGDHEADMRAAREAFAPLGRAAAAVGVTTGPCAEAALYAAGADVVLPSLDAFPEWLSTWAADHESGWAAGDLSIA
jgi:phosphoglycolate phosphatase